MIRLEVQNDRTGTEWIGNYNVTLILPPGPVRGRRARVENFDRSRGAMELLREAIKALEE